MNRMTEKLYKGRRRRGASVIKIVDAFESSGNEILSMRELEDKTGLSRKVLSNTLKEMEKAESIFHHKSEGYIFLDAAIEKLEPLETRYEEEYFSYISILGVIDRIEHNAKRLGLEGIKKAYQAECSKPDSPSSLVVKLGNLFYRWLIDCENHLLTSLNATQDGVEPSSPWRNCSVCHYGKHIGGNQIRCSYDWQKQRGSRVGERSDIKHDSKDYCAHFELRILR